MFWKFVASLASKQQTKEVESFLTILRTMDPDETAHVLVMALEWAETLKDEKGWDLFYPAVVVALDDTAVMQMSKLAVRIQKEGRLQQVAGLMVWVHSLRAFIDPAIRPYAREIWAFLSRGLPHIPQATSNTCPSFSGGVAVHAEQARFQETSGRMWVSR